MTIFKASLNFLSILTQNGVCIMIKKKPMSNIVLLTEIKVQRKN